MIDAGSLLVRPPQSFDVTASIPAGTYTVSWESFDYHVGPGGHGGQGQISEVWFLDAGGFTSDSTEDIPGNVNTAQGVLGANFVVGSDQTSVTFRHGGPPGKTNSVYPICAALDPVSPPVPPTLTLVKDVFGGTAFADDWTLSATALNDDKNFSNKGGSGTPTAINANVDYVLSEAPTDGGAATDNYAPGSWSCVVDENGDPAIGSTIKIDNGESAVCTITNTYNPPPPPQKATLTLVKTVDGGPLSTSDFPVFIGEQQVVWGETYERDPGNYTVSETQQNGYTAGTWSCEINDGLDGQATANVARTIALKDGDIEVCRITNTYTTTTPPTTTPPPTTPVPVPGIGIVKDVVPATIPGGTATEVTWTITVTNTGDEPLQSVTLTDALVPACDLSIGDLALGESKTQTCTSSYTPDGPTWTFTNVANATGVGLTGTTVTAQDDAQIGTTLVAASATIGDTVWSDENANGIQDNGEKGIANAKVRLTFPDSTTLDATTNSNGLYLFSALEAGTYKAELILSSIPVPEERSLRITTAKSFTIELADGQSYLDADFGVVATLPNTGIDADVILAIAIALLVAGAALLLTVGRREDGDATA